MNRFDTHLDLMFEGDSASNIDAILFRKVKHHVMKSGGRLKNPLATGEITLNKIIAAIKNERCLRTDERDLGNTYLEQIVGSAIRKSIPVDYINQARGLFGMPKLSSKDLRKEKKKRVQQSSKSEPKHTGAASPYAKE
jgi:hypothetical protein